MMFILNVYDSIWQTLQLKCRSQWWSIFCNISTNDQFLTFTTYYLNIRCLFEVFYLVWNPVYLFTIFVYNYSFLWETSDILFKFITFYLLFLLNICPYTRKTLSCWKNVRYFGNVLLWLPGGKLTYQNPFHTWCADGPHTPHLTQMTYNAFNRNKWNLSLILQFPHCAKTSKSRRYLTHPSVCDPWLHYYISAVNIRAGVPKAYACINSNWMMLTVNPYTRYTYLSMPTALWFVSRFVMLSNST